ncbi:LOW QUALITY PROTEIN: Integrase catalytic core protein [Phytophthora palmivora]|uniref:Integrase catalytic core protein n=1 Tax=Phytophthora palmivora TaxID=4796 RepID=A0A2P4XTG9_9STRA|nr:LOW QUALITY PROTEIN: Integrase catalytic core protein [Phytophthora palmivora]
MVRIIEAKERLTLLDAKEMLRQECEVMKKCEVKEEAFRASVRNSRFRGGRRNGSSRRIVGGRQGVDDGEGRRHEDAGPGQFQGKCYLWKKFGHKKASCPRKNGGDDEYVFSATTDAASSKVVWILDSGASSHMSFDQSAFREYRTLRSPIEITITNGQRLPAAGVGGGKSIKLTNVLYVPQLDRNLLSISALTAKNVFRKHHATLTQKSSIVAKIARMGKLFPWSVTREEACRVETSCDEASKQPWHARLGHVAQSRMELITKACDGVRIEDVCEGCAHGKMSTNAFTRKSGSEVKTTRAFEGYTRLALPMLRKIKIDNK